MILPGTVVRVNRAARLAEVLPVGLNRPIGARFDDAKRPPPPLSQVSIEQGGGGWVVRDELSLRDEILHEDFNTVLHVAPTLYADTIWATAATGTVDQSGLAGGRGVARLTTTGAAADTQIVAKDDTALTLDADHAMWYSAVVALDVLTATRVTLGLLTAAGEHVWITYDTSNPAGQRAQLATAGPLGSLQANLPFEPSAARAFFTVDVVMLAASFGAAWFDGDGPYALFGPSTSVPAIGTGVHPRAQVVTLTAATRAIFVDWIHVEQFTNVVHPDRLYDAAESSTGIA